MSERSRTGYVTQFPLDIKKPKSDVVGIDATKHEHKLWELKNTYDLVIGQRERFLTAKQEIDQRLAEGELGVVGHRRALKALRDKAIADLDGPRKTVASARKYGESIVLSSPTDSADLDKPITMRQLRAEDARKRTIDRFERLDPSARRNAIRVASEKSDWTFLQMLLDEPALIDARTAKAIEMDIARNSQPYAFECWQDLNGRVVDGTTEPDPLTGALPVLSFVIDDTEKWIDKQTEVESTLAERLAEKAASNGAGGAGSEGA